MSIETMGNHGAKELQNIAIKFKMDPAQVVKEWDELLTAMLVDPKYLALSRGLEPTVYWCEWIKDSNMPWSPHMLFIVKAFLSIGLGTADVERGFSLLK